MKINYKGIRADLVNRILQLLYLFAFIIDIGAIIGIAWLIYTIIKYLN